MADGDPFTGTGEAWPQGSQTGVASIRHEVNNGLGIVFGYAELLLEEPELPPHLREHVVEILRGAEAAQAALVHLRETAEAGQSD
jgi:hypothetical protein